MSNEPDHSAEYVPFEAFRNGLPRGRFHVIVNPKLAPAFVAHRTLATQLSLAMIGPGTALAFYGHTWVGAALVAAGVAFRMAVKWRAGPILLHLASHLPSVYAEAIAHGVMEVRRR